MCTVVAEAAFYKQSRCAMRLLHSSHAVVRAKLKLTAARDLFTVELSGILCPAERPAMTALEASQAFRVHYTQELKLRYGSDVQQEVGEDHQPARQPLPDPAGITLDARGYSVHLEIRFGLKLSPGVRYYLNAGCWFVFPY